MNVRKTPGKCSGVGSEQFREIGILKIAYPVRHPKMAQVDDGGNAKLFHPGECGIGKGPVVTVRRYMCFIIRWTITQITDPQVLYQPEISFPMLVMGRFLHFIYPVDATAGKPDSRVTIFDASGEHEFISCHTVSLID